MEGRNRDVSTNKLKWNARIALLHQAITRFSACTKTIKRYRPEDSHETWGLILTEASSILGTLCEIAAQTLDEQKQGPLASISDNDYFRVRTQIQHSLDSLESLVSCLDSEHSDGIVPEATGTTTKIEPSSLLRLHDRLRRCRSSLVMAVQSIWNESANFLSQLSSLHEMHLQNSRLAQSKELGVALFESAILDVVKTTKYSHTISPEPVDYPDLIGGFFRDRYLKVKRSWTSSKLLSPWIGQLFLCVVAYDNYNDHIRSQQDFFAEHRTPVSRSNRCTFLRCSLSLSIRQSGATITPNILYSPITFLPFHHDLCRAIEHGDMIWVLEFMNQPQLGFAHQLRNRSVSFSFCSYAISCSQLELAEILHRTVARHDDIFDRRPWLYLKRELLRKVSHGYPQNDLAIYKLRRSLPDRSEASNPALDQLLQAVLDRDYAHVEKAEDIHLNGHGVDGYSALHLATMLNDERMIKAMCVLGADVQLADILGKTPLHFICEAEKFSHLSAQILCDHGAGLDVQDTLGHTPLHRAIAHDSPRAVEYLLQCGADPNIRDFTREDTPLNMLSGKKDIDVVHHEILQALVKFGARLDIADGAGATPLLNATRNHSVEFFKYLHRAGASLGQIDANGRSILHYAAIWGSYELISYMASACDLNVDPDLPDDLGRRASDMIDQEMRSERVLCYGALPRKPKDCATFHNLCSNIHTAQDKRDHELDPDYRVTEDGSRGAARRDSEMRESGIDTGFSDADFSSTADRQIDSDESSVFSVDEVYEKSHSTFSTEDTSVRKLDNTYGLSIQPDVFSSNQLGAIHDNDNSVATPDVFPPLLSNSPASETLDIVDDDSSVVTSDADSMSTRDETMSAPSSVMLTQSSTGGQTALNRIANLLSKQDRVAHVIHKAAGDPDVSFPTFTSALKLSFRHFALQFSEESGDFHNAARYLLLYADMIAMTTLKKMEVSLASAKFIFNDKRGPEDWLTEYEACLESELDNYNLIQQSQRQENQSSIAQNPADNIPDFANERLRAQILNSRAIVNLPEAFSDITYPSFHHTATRLVLRTFQAQESRADMRQADMPFLMSLIADLSHASPRNADLKETLENSWLNSAKLAVESLTGRNWDWGPWHPPCEPLARNYARLEWKCNCGEFCSANLPLRLARQLQQLIKKHSIGTPQSTGNELSSASDSTFASVQQDGSVIQLRDLSSNDNEINPSPLGAGVTPARVDDQSRGNRQDQTRPRYIFLVVSSDRHRLSQLNATDNDMRKFARDLRTEYYRLRGFWRRWFSISKFSHCDFVKFEKFCPHEYEHRGLGLPDCQPHADDYWFHPRPPDYSNPPIGPREFRHIFEFYAYQPFIYNFEVQNKSLALLVQPPVQWPRFFSQIPPLFRNLRDGKLPKDSMRWIPQRFRYFEEGTFERESLWGLHAREKPSVLMALSYMIIFLSPSLAFCFIYLFGLGGETVDLQNATAPFTISITFVSMFIGWLFVEGRDTPEKSNVR